jgi:hypothetical protein
VRLFAAEARPSSATTRARRAEKLIGRCPAAATADPYRAGGFRHHPRRRQTVGDAHGRADIVVNSAGFTRRCQRPDTLTDEMIDSLMSPMCGRRSR